MIDLHCHLLPGVDDGAGSLAESVEMAKMMVADGVSIVACTPHIMPGVYNNAGKDIRVKVSELQRVLDTEGIALALVVGADVHVAPDLVHSIQSGAAVTLHDSRYVLIEPPHHVAPPRMEDMFFGLMAAGYCPILTHPERLSWIDRQYGLIQRLSRAGVWMQLTSGSLLGAFGQRPKHWALRMLDEGMCHVLATDAHNTKRRPPTLRAGFEAAAARVGIDEATNMVLHRPYGILENRPPHDMISPTRVGRERPTGRSEGFWTRIGALIDGVRGTSKAGWL